METKKKTTTIKRREVYVPALLHVRETDDGSPSRTISGYAILFDTPSSPLWDDNESVAREVIDRAAITRELLDQQDIKMTMFHDRQLILARSNKGSGTLSYNVDEKGVSFEFEAPNTVDGDKALELVRRGDIAGCSFAFTTYYYDPGFVERQVKQEAGKTEVTYRVKSVLSIRDFTLAADPAYPDTSVEARELAQSLREEIDPPKPDPATEREQRERVAAQVAEMRAKAHF